jgi:hypothetical protein
MKYSFLRDWVHSGFLGRRGGRHRPGNRALTARRRSHRMYLEYLEDRIALSTILPESSPVLVQAMSTNENSAARSRSATYTRSQALASVANSTADVSPNGDVIVSALDGSSVETFQNVGNGWKLIAWNHWQEIGMFEVWVKDNWAPNGTLVESGWAGSGPGSTRYFQLTVQKDITLILYGAAGYEIYYGIQAANSTNAIATWTLARSKDGGVGIPLEYDVVQNGTSWAADWKNQTVYPDPEKYYPSGWLEWYPNHYSVLVPSPHLGYGASPLDGLATYINHVGVEQQRGNALIAVPPDVTEQQGQENGHPADTFWNSANTTSITFVYEGQDKKNLIEQIYGSSVGGKWVTITDHSKAFISQTATYDKQGGTIETSATTFEAANGYTVTLYGTWTSGTAVDNATGIETGTDYLGFSSVTVQYQNGKPVTRYGVLGQYLGGFYATDTFNSSGTSIIERDLAASKGDPIFQTWTEDNGNALRISWSNPDPSTSKEVVVYDLDVPHSHYTGYTMVNFSVALVKPIEFSFRNGENVKITTYAWRAFLSHSRANGWTWNYREQAQTGREHIAHSYPSAQLPFDSQPVLDQYWNKA